MRLERVGDFTYYGSEGFTDLVVENMTAALESARSLNAEGLVYHLLLKAGYRDMLV